MIERQINRRWITHKIISSIEKGATKGRPFKNSTYSTTQLLTLLPLKLFLEPFDHRLNLVNHLLRLG